MLLNTEEADLLLTYKSEMVKDDPNIVFVEPPTKRPRVGFSMNVDNLFASSILKNGEAIRQLRQEV